MKKIVSIVLMFFSVFPVIAIDWETLKNNSEEYLWGEGYGVTLGEADQSALNDLVSKISVQVIAEDWFEEFEEATNTGIEGQSKYKSVISTYSQATLTNTEKKVLKNEPDAHVVRWVKRSEIDRIFESRKNKVLEYAGSAELALQKGKINFALKDLYWSLLLLKTLRYPNEVKYTNSNDEEVLLMTWLPNQINEIFSDIKIDVVKRTGKEIELFISYKGKPVSSIDYSYFDGQDWSSVYSAKDGMGVLELAPGNAGTNFQIRFECAYYGESHIDPEVKTVLEAQKTVALPRSYFYVKCKVNDKPVKELAKVKDSPTTSSFSQIDESLHSKPKAVKDVGDYAKNIEAVVSAISTKKYDIVNHLFTTDGLEIYQRLLKYGQAKVVGTPKYKFYDNSGAVVVRGLQLAFSFKSGMRKSFVEDVVFTFDESKKINNITFGLGETAVNDILCNGVWSETARFAIMNFLENYQTAFALKRHEYISSIFDDDAVIITATVMDKPRRKTLDGQGYQFSNNPIIKYNRHTKDSYLAQLKRSFCSKEYINLRFADNDVRKLGKGGEMYAIQISQEYYSSNYGDKGYLFLMVDINDPNNPIIKVRTWQPEKDPDFGLYDEGYFK